MKLNRVALTLIVLSSAIRVWPSAADDAVAMATATTSEPRHAAERIVFTDRVRTGDRLFARLLLGGRVMVMAREGSTLRITEVGGATTIDIEEGRVAVTVDRGRMSSDALVEVRTPHAVVGVPSATLVVGVSAGASTFSVDGGHADVFSLDPATGRPMGPPASVGARQVITVPSATAEPPTAEVMRAAR
jgi:hypothetical protein